jgi:DNA-binding response OmpR family regulator
MKNILLVEDEEMLVNVLATVLEDEGYKVSKSTSAEEALSTVTEFKPDLIISDVRLPQKDGFAMLKELRKDTTISAVPFICLTALDDMQTQQRAKILGAAAYMTKPFDVDDLVKLVRQVLL